MEKQPRPLSAPPDLDLPAIIDGVRAGAPSSAWLKRWLPSTYAEPELFHQALRAHAALRRGGLKTSASGVVDFYHDCVLAHLGQQRRALVVRHGGADQELSFEALHARCGALASAWRDLGVEPGQCVCVIVPPGIDYVVALLTGLRMGVVVSALPLHGPTFVRNRLLALKPDGVVVGDSYRSAAQSWGLSVLPAAGTRETGVVGSHGYAPTDPVLRLFSPFGDSALTPLDLAAAPLHAGLLRDALLVFALDARDTLAMPGFEALVVQPTSLLTALLAGASWAELSLRDIAEAPDSIARQGLTLLGVTRGLRDLLLALGRWPQARVRSWFRWLSEVSDVTRWDELGRLAGAADVAGFNLAISASAGGVLLFGPALRQTSGAQVWPPAGQVFQLSEVAASELPALGDAGIYTRLLDGEVVAGAPRSFLTRTPEAYIFAGNLDVGLGSITYPSEEVSALVERYPGVEYASVVVSAGRGADDARVAVLAFVEDSGEPSERSGLQALASELSTLVAHEMGELFRPSRVEIFPLRPRTIAGAVDTAWCRSQYLSGALRAKARRELFLLLSRLSYILDTPEPALSPRPAPESTHAV